MEYLKVDVRELDTAQNPLISMVVPVYKTEQYLARCVDSVLNQSYQNFELILVDDGSPDNSGILCDQYAEKDSRIRVIHQENRGQGAARNRGVAESRAEHICFVDSDDYIHRDYLLVLLLAFQKTGADIVQSRIILTQEEKMPLSETRTEVPYKILDGKTAPNSYAYKVAPVGKLYRRGILGKDPFSSHGVNEDDASYYRLAYGAKTVCLVDYVTYFYYQSPVSIMRGKKGDQSTDYISIYEDRIRFYEERNEPEMVLGSRERLCLILMLNYAAYLKNGTNQKDLSMMRDVFHKQYLEVRHYHGVGIAKKTAYFLFDKMPEITARFIGLLR